ncbi:hypothetical protein Tco_0435671 [Tanacetum coccineum]
MGRDIIQLEGTISTISGEYLLEFTLEYGILENLHPEVPGLGETIVDFPEGKTLPNSSLTTVSDRRDLNKRIFPTAVDWRASAPRDEMPIAGSYSAADVTLLNTDQMDLFSLVRNPNPFKVKTGTRPRTTHEVPLLTATANRVIDLEDPVASGSPGTPSTVERSPLDFDNEDPAPSLDEGARAEEHVQEGLAHEIPPNTPTAVSNLEPLSYAKPQPHPVQDITQSSKGVAAKIPTKDVATTKVNVQLSMGSLNLRKSTSPSLGGSPRGIYQPGWGVTNNCRLDSLEACQDLVDHIVPSGYFSELRHLHNTEFLSQYNMNLVRQVAMGSQLRLRFEQEARLLKKATTKIARRDQKIHAREEEIKKLNEEIRSLRTMETEVHGLRNRTQNLETLLEAKVDMKKSTEAKSMDLAGELESLREERIKAAFEEFKKSKDEKVEQRCAEMDARLDALSIDFDEELYPHMLTAIAGRRWVIGHGLRLAIMKCAESKELRQAFADVVSTGIVKGMSEGLKYGVENGEAKLGLAAIEPYDPEAEAKYVTALTALRDLKYPLVNQLDRLRDAPIDLLMASLHLESDSREDAPEWIRKLRPDTSQLKIPIYPEVRNP